jgi:hypothetical protein
MMCANVQNQHMEKALSDYMPDTTIIKGRLILAELILKASAGYYNSHTEEAFLGRFSILKADRTPKINGRRFLCGMFYKHSGLKPEAFYLINKYRKD